MKPEIITIFGGSGFLGRYIVRELAHAGYRVNVVSRNPDSALPSKTAGLVGQISTMQGNIRDVASVERAVKSSYAVINLVGILYPKGKQKFDTLHAQAAETVAKAARKAGVKRLIHVSALGVDKAAKSRYARSKLNGEKAVMAAFPNATILRPSIVFGPEDNFFNMFAGLAKFSPFLPLIGGGKTKFQPVYVGDIAKAALTILEHKDTAGETYELGGPKIYSFKELLQFVLIATRRKCLLVPIPFALAKIQAAFLEHLPGHLLTRDQVRLLKTNNVVNKKARGFTDLHISPTPLEDIVPHYLEQYKKQ